MFSAGQNMTGQNRKKEEKEAVVTGLSSERERKPLQACMLQRERGTFSKSEWHFLI